MLIAIGDIHGQAWKLCELLNRLSLEEDDRLIFLGDYVDRGPEVKLTLDILIGLKEKRPNTIFLRGNHDQTMMDIRDLSDPKRNTRRERNEIRWWYQYGGQETIDSYGPGLDWFRRVPDAHWEFLESTVLEHREGGYIFVHAGLLPDGHRWFDKEDPRMWIREQFIESKQDFGGVVVYGHTRTYDGYPFVMPNKIGLDTGAAYGGPLTAALLTPGEPELATFVQA